MGVPGMHVGLGSGVVIGTIAKMSRSTRQASAEYAPITSHGALVSVSTGKSTHWRSNDSICIEACRAVAVQRSTRTRMDTRPGPRFHTQTRMASLPASPQSGEPSAWTTVTLSSIGME